MKHNTRIAVLDSGIDSSVENNNIKVFDEGYDDNGHGTMCYETIRRLSPNSCFGIYKILDRSLSASSVKLIELLEKVYETGAYDIIHLSLSTSEPKYMDRLRDICRKLVKNGAVIVASQNNTANVDSFPCDFPEVMGVGGGIFEADEVFDYDPGRVVQIMANKVPSLTKSLIGRYRFFGGTSKAAACFTGTIAARWNEVEKYGIDSALKRISAEKAPVQNDTISAKTGSFVEQRWGDFFLNGVREEEARRFLTEFEEEFFVKVEWEKFTLLDFENRIDLSRKLSLYV